MINRKLAGALAGLLAGAAASSALAAPSTQNFPTYAPLYSLDGTKGGVGGGGLAQNITLAGPSNFTHNDVTVSGDGSGAVTSYASSLAVYAHSNNATITKSISSVTPAHVGTATYLNTPDSSTLAFAYITEFKIGSTYTQWNGGPTVTMSNSKLSLTLNQTTTGSSYLTGSDFFLEDLGTSAGGGSGTTTLLGTATAGTGHSLNLVANLNPNSLTHFYAIVVTVPKSVITSSTNSFTVSGSVPLPGTLAPLGAFLLGLIGLRYGYKRHQAGW